MKSTARGVVVLASAPVPVRTGLLTQLAHHDTMMSSYHELKEDSGGCQCEPGSIYCPVDIDDGSPRLVYRLLTQLHASARRRCQI